MEKLHSLKLSRMAKALEEQLQTQDIESLSFEGRFGLLVDQEMTERRNRKLGLRLKKAKLRLNAVVEDIDYRTSRGLDKALLLQLASCRWIEEHLNVLITGPTGRASGFRLSQYFPTQSVGVFKAVTRSKNIVLDDFDANPTASMLFSYEPHNIAPGKRIENKVVWAGQKPDKEVWYCVNKTGWIR